MYKKIIRPLLFNYDAEKIHDFTLKQLSKGYTASLLKSLLKSEDEKLKVKVGNLMFRNPIGLAAGLDKNGVAIPAWDSMGFGFAEIGTVTPVPQEGYPKPRMFRLPEYKAIINRLGFNNLGMDVMDSNIKEGKDKAAKDFIVGV